jgi:hypothetical protein
MGTARAIRTVDERSAVPPRRDWEQLRVGGEFDRLTHYLFRYPAKFHPPVVRTLLDRYTKKGNLVLDPFCGSGTLLVEACVLGRRSIGIDVDPVAVMVAQAKVHHYQIPRLRDSAKRVLNSMRKYRRPGKEYKLRMFEDLTERQYGRQVQPVRAFVPAIPNLFHWFRKYVILDLARMRQGHSVVKRATRSVACQAASWPAWWTVFGSWRGMPSLRARSSVPVSRQPRRNRPIASALVSSAA